MSWACLCTWLHVHVYLLTFPSIHVAPLYIYMYTYMYRYVYMNVLHPADDGQRVAHSVFGTSRFDSVMYVYVCLYLLQS